MSFLLISIAETHWQFEPCLACKGSARSDRLDILGGQAFHIESCLLIVYPQKIPAYFYSGWIVGLIYVFRGLLRDFYIHGYLSTEIVQDCSCPHLLYDILIFLEWNALRHRGYFRSRKDVSSSHLRWYRSLKSSMSKSRSGRLVMRFS